MEFAQTVAGAKIGGVVGQPTTPTETELLLFAVLVSGVVLLTVAVLVTVVPVDGAVTSMVMFGALPVASAPIVQVMAGLPLHVQPVPLTLFSVTPAGSVSFTVTSAAVPEPVLPTTMV